MSAAVATATTAQDFACPACGRITRHAQLYRKNGCDIFACSECRIGRTETRTFDPQTYYTGDYFSGGRPDGYGDYRGAERVLRAEFAHAVDFVRRFKPNGKLIELGCAYGFFLEEAKKHYEVAGIELAEDAAEDCRRRGLHVLSGVADEANMAALGKADVIVLLDVIEHLPHPDETLALCTRHLNPGGVIMLTTGDFGSPLARWAGPAWRLMTPPQHLWFFTKDSIARLGKRLGLSVESSGHPWKLVPVSLIAFQLRRMLGMRAARTETGSRVGVPVNLFDAMRVVLRKPA